MEAVGEVIKKKGAITKSEFREIFNSHGIGFWAGNRLGILLRNHDLVRAREEPPLEEKSEAKIPEVKVPAKELFHKFGKKELGEGLSDLFKKMNEREVDSEFEAERDFGIRVFGFRARKGIIIGNEACIDIAVNMELGGGRAWIHMEKGFANTLLKTGVFSPSDAVKTEFGFRRPVRDSIEDKGPKLPYVSYSDILTPEVQEKLRGDSRFTNFLSVLDFLKGQKIVPDVFILDHTEEWFVGQVKSRYKTAMQIKELENRGLKPEEVVKKEFNLANFNSMKQELMEHGMKREVEILERIRKERFGKTCFEPLIYVF
jgi:hypothetical protein